MPAIAINQRAKTTHSKDAVYLVRNDEMKKCSVCGRGMISDGSVCGWCNPATWNRILPGEYTGRRKAEASAYPLDKVEDSSPSNRCFYFWAVRKASWPIIQTAVDTLRDIRLQEYRKPASPPIFWNMTTGVVPKSMSVASREMREFKSAPFPDFFKTKNEEFKRMSDLYPTPDWIGRRHLVPVGASFTPTREFYSDAYESPEERKQAFAELAARHNATRSHEVGA